MRSKYLVAVPLLSFVLMAFAGPQQPQDKSQRPSPPGTAEVTLNGKKVTIEYSRPSLRGRKMDTLAPYGKVWRTGANEAAGKYTLYSLPAEGTWKLIINKQTGQWGTRYDETQDLARVDMQKSQTTGPVEQFTISFEKKGNDAANLVLEWENTRLTVPVKGK